MKKVNDTPCPIEPSARRSEGPVGSSTEEYPEEQGLSWCDEERQF